MKLSKSLFTPISLLTISTLAILPAEAQSSRKFRHLPPAKVETAEIEEEEESLLPDIDPEVFRVRDVDEIISSLPLPEVTPTPINKVLGPWVFLGYRHVNPRRSFTPVYIPEDVKVATNDSIAEEFAEFTDPDDLLREPLDSVGFAQESIYLEELEEPTPDMKVLSPDYTPSWLADALTQYRIQEDFMYSNMVDNYKNIEYAYWDLPVPPRLNDDEVSFEAFIKKLDLPEVETDKAILPEQVIRKIHWLHRFNASAQFSQAYVSSNWYQGGNNHLSLLLGANWNVQLNKVFHPNLLFESNLSYKLGLNSTPQDEVHAYSISEDILQWNLNTGLKAFKKWYYSFTTQFKTQIFRNYAQNSMQRTASFLSPGDFNMGIGMSYNHSTPKVQLTASIAPLSYNLKTCITDKINHSQFNIEPDKKTHSEIGSNAEINMTWKVMWNINYRTRLFMFTDYDYFLADWEHTINFDVNKFLSTQIYVHMRYDTSTETLTKWKHFMLREVLSFGLSYTFSTK